MNNLSVLVGDVSRYQRKIRPYILRSNGIRAMIAKSSGGLNKDVKYEQHYADCLANKMPVAPYHWVDPIYSPERQMDYLIDINRGKNIFAYVLDIEQYWNNWDAWYKAVIKQISWSLVPRIRPDLLSKHAYQCARYLAARVEKPVVIYTSYGYVTSYAPGMAEWLGEFFNWPANYIIRSSQKLNIDWPELYQKYVPIGKKPLLPPGVPENKVVGWQYTGDLISLPGMYSDNEGITPSPSDLSLFDPDWLAWATETKIDPVVNIPEKQSDEYVVSNWVTRGLRLREEPNTNCGIISVLSAKTRLVATGKKAGDWLQVKNFDLTGWVHSAYVTKL